MANNKKLRVTEFDFDDVKSNLKTFLKNQTEFTDYDFEGSGMSALLDVLAYNTHYLGYNMNMLANEMFLDSSVLRSSAVSHAKTLGYEPSSSTTATASVTVNLNTTSVTTATMPAGTKFSTKILDKNYSFVTLDDVTASNIGTTIPYENIKIYEGSLITSRYIVDTNDIAQKFIINDPNVDTSTLRVQVQNSASDSTILVYTKTNDITQVSSSSQTFWLQEIDGGRFEVYFGDGVIGKKLEDGNIVLLTYVVSNKELGNGASTFTNTGAIATVSDITVTTIASSTGGAERESISSIKTNAPLDYASQGRAVTTEDYKVYVKKLYANTESVQVWGGENGSFDSSLGVVSTPEYGKVFISVKTTTGNNLTSSEKSSIETQLGRYKVASITPVVVDPETIFLILVTKFKYNQNATTKTSEDLVNSVNTTLTNYNNNTLKKFNNVFRHSEITSLIDNSHTSILNNQTTVNLGKFITPTLNSKVGYNINFSNKLYNPYSGYNDTKGGILASTGFFISGDATNEHFFDDDGKGNLRLYYMVGSSRVYTNATAGTVDYTDGSVAVSSLNITSISKVDGVASTKIRITVVPESKDIVPVRNQVLEIDFVNTSIVGEVDTIASGDVGASSNYTTNSSFPTNQAF